MIKLKLGLVFLFFLFIMAPSILAEDLDGEIISPDAYNYTENNENQIEEDYSNQIKENTSNEITKNNSGSIIFVEIFCAIVGVIMLIISSKTTE